MRVNGKVARYLPKRGEVFKKISPGNVYNISLLVMSLTPFSDWRALDIQEMCFNHGPMHGPLGFQCVLSEHWVVRMQPTFYR